MAEQMTLADWLDDLTVRFLLNLPHDELSSMPRLCFQAEEAQWFYEDFIRPMNPKLPSLNLRSFCLTLFKHCPLFSNFGEAQHVAAYEEFLAYKVRVPVRGAILLDESMDSVLLVKGWKKGASWSFPRGKINKDEQDIDCAVREVYEECGYHLGAAGLVKSNERNGKVKSIEISIREQHLKLFVFRGTPAETHFAPRTRKEISDIQWYSIKDLPGSKKKATNKQASKYYMVAPFLGPLKKWINLQREADALSESQALPVEDEPYTEPEETPEPALTLPTKTPSDELKKILSINGPAPPQPFQHVAAQQDLLAMLHGRPTSHANALPRTPFEQVQPVWPLQQPSTPHQPQPSRPSASVQQGPPQFPGMAHQDSRSFSFSAPPHRAEVPIPSAAAMSQFARQSAAPAHQFPQFPQGQNESGPSVPDASQLPAPRLNAHAASLLETLRKTTDRGDTPLPKPSFTNPNGRDRVGSQHQDHLLGLLGKSSAKAPPLVSPAPPTPKVASQHQDLLLSLLGQSSAKAPPPASPATPTPKAVSPTPAALSNTTARPQPAIVAERASVAKPNGQARVASLHQDSLLGLLKNVSVPPLASPALPIERAATPTSPALSDVTVRPQPSIAVQRTNVVKPNAQGRIGSQQQDHLVGLLGKPPATSSHVPRALHTQEAVSATPPSLPDATARPQPPITILGRPAQIESHRSLPPRANAETLTPSQPIIATQQTRQASQRPPSRQSQPPKAFRSPRASPPVSAGPPTPQYSILQRPGSAAGKAPASPVPSSPLKPQQVLKRPTNGHVDISAAQPGEGKRDKLLALLGDPSASPKPSSPKAPSPLRRESNPKDALLGLFGVGTSAGPPSELPKPAVQSSPNPPPAPHLMPKLRPSSTPQPSVTAPPQHQRNLLNLFTTSASIARSPETPISPFALGTPITKRPPPLLQQQQQGDLGGQARSRLGSVSSAAGSGSESGTQTPTEKKELLLRILNRVVESEGYRSSGRKV